MLKIHITRLFGWLAVFTGAVVGQVTPVSEPPLSFEVASIKPAPPFDPGALLSGAMRPGMVVGDTRVYIGSMSVRELICSAYNVSRNQIAGGPDWLAKLDADKFEIIAKIPDHATKGQAPKMLQSLLADRFKLVAHREKRITAVYALIVGKDGPKFKEAAPDPSAPASAAHQPTTSDAPANDREMTSDTRDDRGTTKTKADGMAGNGGVVGRMVGVNGQYRFEYDSVTMERFASLLSKHLDRPVIDQTGLRGNYRVSYEINLSTMGRNLLATQLASNSATADAMLEPDDSLWSSVKQLGLKLSKRDLPCDVVVVDHLEKTPTEN